MNFNIRTLALALICIASLHGLQAQVTIGSDLNPVKGALLDLKQHAPDQNNTTADKGLLLPRVALSDITSLNDLENVDASAPLKYAGMMIYNVKETKNACFTIPKGIYVWTSEKWEGIGVTAGGIPLPGSYRDDLILMQKIKDDNPTAGIQYTIDLNDPDKNDPDKNITSQEYAFQQVCGQKRLWQLYFGNKPNLTKIDVTGAVSLNSLSLYQTGVTKLDVSTNKNMTYLDITSSPIQEIDLSKNTDLLDLRTSKSGIKNLDLSHNKKLQFVAVSDSPIETLDLSKHTELIEIRAIQTKLSVLDISKSINLRKVDLAPNNKNTTISKVIINQKTIDILKGQGPYGNLKPEYPNAAYQIVND